MSEPFNIGEDAISLNMANELVLAYSERRQAIGQSAVAPLTKNDDARDRTIWRAMQDWLETNCTSFINHVSGPLNPAGTGFLYFTLATWRTAAGINASGFYRRDGDNKETYGKIAAGDCRIKENFQELQNGFSVLTTVVLSPGAGAYGSPGFTWILTLISGFNPVSPTPDLPVLIKFYSPTGLTYIYTYLDFIGEVTEFKLNPDPYWSGSYDTMQPHLGDGSWHIPKGLIRWSFTNI